ncbi:unnamed protein product [Sympodiomycopsis kandeliae]
MTIPDHFQLQTGSPIYCLDWLADDILVYAGGGGKSRTGVGNFLRALYVPSASKSSADIKILAEVKLSSDEDAPMAMAVDKDSSNTIVLAINESDETKLQDNQHLRIYNFELQRKEGKDSSVPTITISHQSASPSLPLKDVAESYIRLLTFSPHGDQLLTGSTDGRYALHEYPSLKPAFDATEDFLGEELMDADFSQDGDQVVLCTGKKLKVFGTYPNPAATLAEMEKLQTEEEQAPVSKTEATLAVNQSLGLGPKSSQQDVQGTNAAKTAFTAATGQVLGPPPVWQTIQNPALGGEGGCEFRAVRFGKRNQPQQPSQSVTQKDGEQKEEEKKEEEEEEPKNRDRNLFTVVNAKASSKGSKGKRKSFLTSWKLPSTSLILTRQLSEKPITTCSLSTSGSLLAYGSSDLSLGIVDTQSLKLVTRILNAHDFPATKLSWNPATTFLASGSADGTLRIVAVQEKSLINPTNQTLLLTVLLTLIILLLALYIQRSALV